jgi:hypothetical protein
LDERIETAFKNIPYADWSMSWYKNEDADRSIQSVGCTASYFERQRREMAASEPLRLDNADRKWGPQKAYLDSLSRQARSAEVLALISPVGVFRAAATAVCGTDRRSQEKRLDDVRRYRETLLSWLKGKNMFEKFEYFTPTPPSAFRTADQLVEARTGGKFKTLAAYESWAAGQSDFRKSFEVLNTVKLPGDAPEDYPFLQLGDMPRFRDRPVSVAAGLQGSAFRLGLLLFEVILLFTLAYVSFIRYDVR